MDTAHLFAGLWATVGGPLHEVTVRMATGLMTYAKDNMHTAIVLAVSLFVLRQMIQRDDDLPLHFVAKLTSIAYFMGGIMVMPFYLQIINLAEHMPAQLIAAATGTPPAADWAAALDVAMARATEPLGRLMSTIEGNLLFHPQRLVTLGMLGVAAFIVVVSFCVIFACNVFLAWCLAVLLGTGPLAWAFWPFPALRQITMSWVESVLAIIVQMVTLTATLTLVAAVQDKLSRHMMTINPDKLGEMFAVAAFFGAINFMLPFLAIAAMWQVNKVYNGVVPGAIQSLIATPQNVGRSMANTFSSSGSGSNSSSGGYSGGRSNSGGGGGNGMQAASAASAQAMPGRPIGRGP